MSSSVYSPQILHFLPQGYGKCEALRNGRSFHWRTSASGEKPTSFSVTKSRDGRTSNHNYDELHVPTLAWNSFCPGQQRRSQCWSKNGESTDEALQLDD